MELDNIVDVADVVDIVGVFHDQMIMIMIMVTLMMMMMRRRRGGHTTFCRSKQQVPMVAKGGIHTCTPQYSIP